MPFLDPYWFIAGLIIILIGMILIKKRGNDSTVPGLVIANIGFYAALVGITTVGENDRFAIVLTTLVVSGIVIMMLPVGGGARIFGLVLAILAGLALAATLTLLPDSSYIKTVITTFVESAGDIARALNPFD